MFFYIVEYITFFYILAEGPRNPYLPGFMAAIYEGGPAKRFSTFVRLETREATWLFKFNALSKVTPGYLNSFG
jgi:hypothetical protein